MKQAILTVALCIAASLLQAENVLKNSDFTAIDDHGNAANWISRQAQITKAGKGGSNSLRLTAAIPAAEKYKGTLVQLIPDFQPGKYLLQGKFKGDAYALWIVIGFNYELQGEKATKWITIAKDLKKDETGWYQFEMPVEVPSGTKKGIVVMEPFCHQKDQYIDIANISLVKPQTPQK